MLTSVISCSSSSSSNRIKTIDDKTALLMRASSSIASIRGVVEELVLNSIDANCGSIKILVDFKTHSVSVVDDGCGMIRQNFDVVGEWSYTTKERDEQSYGLKGEALASIRALSHKLDIFTTSKQSSVSCRKQFNGDGPAHITFTQDDARGYGTTISACGLFEKLPVRLKSFNMANELNGIRSFIQNMSILHHYIKWRLIDYTSGRQKLLVDINGQITVAKRFGCIHGVGALSKMKEVTVRYGPFVITGLMSPPLVDCCHWTRECQHLYLNKRWLRNQDIVSTTIDSLYTKALVGFSNRGPASKHHSPERGRVARHPCFALQVLCSGDLYDILSETDKTKAVFTHPEELRSCIFALIQTMFEQYNPALTAQLTSHWPSPSSKQEPQQQQHDTHSGNYSEHDVAGNNTIMPVHAANDDATVIKKRKRLTDPYTDFDEYESWGANSEELLSSFSEHDFPGEQCSEFSRTYGGNSSSGTGNFSMAVQQAAPAKRQHVSYPNSCRIDSSSSSCYYRNSNSSRSAVALGTDVVSHGDGTAIAPTAAADVATGLHAVASFSASFFNDPPSPNVWEQQRRSSVVDGSYGDDAIYDNCGSTLEYHYDIFSASAEIKPRMVTHPLNDGSDHMVNTDIYDGAGGTAVFTDFVMTAAVGVSVQRNSELESVFDALLSCCSPPMTTQSQTAEQQEQETAVQELLGIDCSKFSAAAAASGSDEVNRAGSRLLARDYEQQQQPYQRSFDDSRDCADTRTEGSDRFGGGENYHDDVDDGAEDSSNAVNEYAAVVVSEENRSVRGLPLQTHKRHLLQSQHEEHEQQQAQSVVGEAAVYPSTRGGFCVDADFLVGDHILSADSCNRISNEISKSQQLVQSQTLLQPQEMSTTRSSRRVSELLSPVVAAAVMPIRAPIPASTLQLPLKRRSRPAMSSRAASAAYDPIANADITLHPTQLQGAQFIGQADAKYIIARLPAVSVSAGSGVGVGSLPGDRLQKYKEVLVAWDQHALSERINFERLQEEMLFAALCSGATGNVHGDDNNKQRGKDVTAVAKGECRGDSGERLESGIFYASCTDRIVLDDAAKHTLESCQPIFARWKFVCIDVVDSLSLSEEDPVRTKHETEIGDADKQQHVFTVLQVPVILGEKLNGNDLLEFISFVACNVNKLPLKLLAPPAVRRIVACKACRSSVSFGDVLSETKCRDLLKNIALCDLPFQCAHGRVALVPMVAMKDLRQQQPQQRQQQRSGDDDSNDDVNCGDSSSASSERKHPNYSAMFAELASSIIRSHEV